MIQHMMSHPVTPNNRVSINDDTTQDVLSLHECCHQTRRGHSGRASIQISTRGDYINQTKDYATSEGIAYRRGTTRRKKHLSYHKVTVLFYIRKIHVIVNFLVHHLML